eukprot:1161749-Pelagomonas_calceolata.AAC.7
MQGYSLYIIAGSRLLRPGALFELCNARYRSSLYHFIFQLQDFDWCKGHFVPWSSVRWKAAGRHKAFTSPAYCCSLSVVVGLGKGRVTKLYLAAGAA